MPENRRNASPLRRCSVGQDEVRPTGSFGDRCLVPFFTCTKGWARTPEVLGKVDPAPALNCIGKNMGCSNCNPVLTTTMTTTNSSPFEEHAVTSFARRQICG